jgi:hypothetical protein
VRVNPFWHNQTPSLRSAWRIRLTGYVCLIISFGSLDYARDKFAQHRLQFLACRGFLFDIGKSQVRQGGQDSIAVCILELFALWHILQHGALAILLGLESILAAWRKGGPA